MLTAKGARRRRRGDLELMTETIGTLLAAHGAGKALTATIEETYARIERHDDPALFIAIRPKAEALAIAERLQASGPEGKPLYGVPFVVKDNIDVAGLPTTAACPAFAYSPGKSAFAVDRLERAGAIVIGKTNLDQFATGLVGVRSPYGIPRNALKPDLIPGGSSSGSATAVGAGLVPFSLGTDTAGSGRVPAALNGIVGLKPSLGALSTSGVVPACRTLDTISVFAGNVADAFAVYEAACAFDESDAYARLFPPPALSALPGGIRLGVPRADQRQFFDDAMASAAFLQDLELARSLGARIVEFDFEPFAEVARALYEGPWVAERYSAVKALIESNPGALHPGHARDHRGRPQVRRDLGVRGLLPARGPEAEDGPCLVGIRCDARSDGAAALHGRRGRGRSDPPQFPARDLHQFRQPARPLRDRGSLEPSRRRTAVERDPDCAVRRRRAHRRRRGGDSRAFQHVRLSPAANPGAAPERPSRDRGRRRASLGAAAQSRARRTRRAFSREVETTPDYRLFALPGSSPAKPGLLRVGDGAGAAIKAEVWTLEPAGFGAFVARIPAPLGIGSIRLKDGGSVQGLSGRGRGGQGGGGRLAFRRLARLSQVALTRRRGRRRWRPQNQPTGNFTGAP